MRYPGLIPGTQKNVADQTYGWDYGTIEDGHKRIDPMLHFGCFTLGYGRQDLI